MTAPHLPRFGFRKHNPAPETARQAYSAPAGSKLSHDDRVRSRLHALFGSSSSSTSDAEAGPSRQALPTPTQVGTDIKNIDGGREHGQGDAAGPSAQAEGLPGRTSIPASPSSQESQDRDAVKVFMCTWNMGDAVPKGDLSVLLGGPIPAYISPDTLDPSSSTSAGIPRLPLTNAHPYHIVVVAGQECPTDSGVPRGLGGGIMKGVGGGKQGHRKEGRKERGDRETMESAEHDNHVRNNGKEPKHGIVEKLDRESELDEPNEEWRGPPLSPMTPSPHPSAANRQPGGKGWSTMLDDWLCGPSHKLEVPASRSYSPSPPNSSAPPDTPALTRSASAPFGPHATGSGQYGSETMHKVSSSVPKTNSLAPHLLDAPHAHPPTITLRGPSHQLIRPVNYSKHLDGQEPIEPPLRSSSPPDRPPRSQDSGSSSDSSSSSSTPRGSPSPPPPVHAFPLPPPPRPATVPLRTKVSKPELVIPDNTASLHRGTGSYVHLVKERLMGMYLSIYVYKGCEHLVQGMDKDYVTAGLAGGRLGNKGGIGISLKFANRTYLFVNSHLAAHTGRNDVRLLNIAKIKADLRLDCFLPPDDPKAKPEDPTERFDTTFWCGDLNFRLEMSRLHAEWLVEQKKYAEALTWDQLKIAMKDSTTNPFPGFEEGPIDFPPTFKYDVWRSVKATNRDLRRSLRRKNSEARSIKGELSTSLKSNGPLAHVIEQDGEHHVLGSDEEVGAETASRRSFDSGQHSIDRSTAGTDLDDAEDEDDEAGAGQDESAINGAHNAHRPFDVALKEKTKHLLSLVKLGSSPLSPSPSRRRSLKRKDSIKDRPRNASEPIADLDHTSRRTSLSSIASTGEGLARPQPMAISTAASNILSPGPAHAGPLLSASPQSMLSPRRPSPASSASPPNASVRRFALKRTLSGRSFKGADIDEDAELEIDMKEDHREGVYDTSKKQRVPSWCDRVLWRTHITPDSPDLSASDPDPVERSRGFNRLSIAFAQFRNQLGRTSSVDPAPSDRVRVGRPRSHTPPAFLPAPQSVASPQISPALGLVESPPASPSVVDQSALVGDDEARGLDRVMPSTQATRRPSLENSPSRTSFSRKASESPRLHSLLDRSDSSSSPPAKPRIAFDPVSSAAADRSPKFLARPRANSDDLAAGSKPDISRSPSFPPRLSLGSGGAERGQAHSQLSLPRSSGGRMADALATKRSRTLSSDPSMSEEIKSLSFGRSPSDNGDAEDGNAFTRFWKELPLPTWLHRGSVMLFPPPDDRKESEDGEGQGEVAQRPRRHLRGEVVCLHYGTIDDAGMRMLEGRSDHRPAIFAAAVYV